MNAITKDGIIFTIVMMGVFGALDFFSNSNVADASMAGFPLKYSVHGGLCPLGDASCGTKYFNALNLAVDIAIPILIGFGTAIVKNKVNKK